jgi:hypothetical protein
MFVSFAPMSNEEQTSLNLDWRVQTSLNLDCTSQGASSVASRSWPSSPASCYWWVDTSADAIDLPHRTTVLEWFSRQNRMWRPFWLYLALLAVSSSPSPLPPPLPQSKCLPCNDATQLSSVTTKTRAHGETGTHQKESAYDWGEKSTRAYMRDA